jgi:hypothetical protein
MQIKLQELLNIKLGSPSGQLRSVPVGLGGGAPGAFLVTYCADFDVDPYVEMFFFPKDTLKMALIDDKGKVVWRRDLGSGVVPGSWFCPVLAFDLDQDGVDEIWFVNNLNTQHPLGVSGYRLERIDPRNGKTTGQWPWPCLEQNQRLSHMFRNFIIGGYVKNDPVLITAQGTYENMYFQGRSPDMSSRWNLHVPADSPGARGSHMRAVSDLDGDNIQELMWGERCIELDRGTELFCADRDHYKGHSDVALPVLDRSSGKWFIYTCRESDNDVSPRVALFDDRGNRVWGKVDQGHMDMGWAARIGDDRSHIAMAVRIGHKTCGPDGRFHEDRDEFVFDLLTGDERELPFSVYTTLPVDLDGDGYHELVRGIAGANGEILDRKGEIAGKVSGTVALASKFMDYPGEQLLTYDADGTLHVWCDQNAEDCDQAQERYNNPLYKTNQHLTSTGYNLINLGGI